MTAPKSWLQASFHAGRGWLRPARSVDESGANLPPALVPIRSLSVNYRRRIAAHLRGLDGEDRYLRFGFPANDEQIDRYVAGLDFARDEIFGIYNRRLELIAVAHLAYPPDAGPGAMAEFGVSVVKHARGRGYGSRLFDHAVMHARNAGVGRLMIQALSENVAMLKIARSAGATVQRSGPESEAFLALPPPSIDSRMAQWVEDQVGEVDYRLKVQAKQFWDVLGSVQEVRQGVRRGRFRSGQ